MPEPSPMVAALPPAVPFVAPEEIEKTLGLRFQLRLGANESAFGPSPVTLQAAASFIPAHYGDPRSTLLRDSLAKHHAVSPENIVVASGIDELLSLFCRAYAGPGAAVVTSSGTYPTFSFGATGAGCRIISVPYRDDKPDLDALAQRSQGAKIVYLANPDNPSGYCHSKDDVEAFRRRISPQCLLLLDEAYADFVLSEELLPLDPNDAGVVRLRTFSKAYGLAGYRIGYALAHPTLVATLDKVRLHFGVNGPAQAAALAALGDQEHLKKVVRLTHDGRVRLSQMGRRLGLDPLPSWTNFVLFRTGEKTDAMVQALLRRRVFIRSGAMGGLRITVGRPDELDRLEPLLSDAAEEVFGTS